MTNCVDPDQKLTDLDLHCLQMQGASEFSRTRVKSGSRFCSTQRYTCLFFYKHQNNVLVILQKIYVIREQDTPAAGSDCADEQTDLCL